MKQRPVQPDRQHSVAILIIPFPHQIIEPNRFVVAFPSCVIEGHIEIDYFFIIQEKLEFAGRLRNKPKSHRKPEAIVLIRRRQFPGDRRVTVMSGGSVATEAVQATRDTVKFQSN